ncbi:MAG: hypothetical protein WDM79_17500 [Terricaulis sp.]
MADKSPDAKEPGQQGSDARYGSGDRQRGAGVGKAEQDKSGFGGGSYGQDHAAEDRSGEHDDPDAAAKRKPK